MFFEFGQKTWKETCKKNLIKICKTEKLTMASVARLRVFVGTGGFRSKRRKKTVFVLFSILSFRFCDCCCYFASQVLPPFVRFFLFLSSFIFQTLFLPTRRLNYGSLLFLSFSQACPRLPPTPPLAPHPHRINPAPLPPYRSPITRKSAI